MVALRDVVYSQLLLGPQTTTEVAAQTCQPVEDVRKELWAGAVEGKIEVLRCDPGMINTWALLGSPSQIEIGNRLRENSSRRIAGPQR